NHVTDAFPRHPDRQALGLEPPAAARRARLLDHVLLELLANGVGCGFAVALFYVIEDALPARLIRAVPALAVILVGDRFPGSALEQDLLHRGRQVAPRRIQVELVSPRECPQPHFAQLATRLAPGQHDPCENAQTLVAQDQAGINLARHARPP